MLSKMQTRNESVGCDDERFIFPKECHPEQREGSLYLAKYVAQSMREILPPLRSVRMTRDVWTTPIFLSRTKQNDQ